MTESTSGAPKTRKTKNDLSPISCLEGLDGVNCVKFLRPSCTQLACARNRGRIAIVDVEKAVSGPKSTGNQVRSISCQIHPHEQSIFTIDYDEVKNILFSCSRDQSVVLTDTRTFDPIRRIKKVSTAPISSLLNLGEYGELAIGTGKEGEIPKRFWRRKSTLWFDPQELIFYDLRKTEICQRIHQKDNEENILRLIRVEDDKIFGSGYSNSVKFWKRKDEGKKRWKMEGKTEKDVFRYTDLYGLCWLRSDSNLMEKKDLGYRREFLVDAVALKGVWRWIGVGGKRIRGLKVLLIQ